MIQDVCCQDFSLKWVGGHVKTPGIVRGCGCGCWIEKELFVLSWLIAGHCVSFDFIHLSASCVEMPSDVGCVVIIFSEFGSFLNFRFSSESCWSALVVGGCVFTDYV